MAERNPGAKPEADKPAAAAADGTADGEKAGSARGGIKPWLPLIATVVVMPVLAYLMTAFVIVPKLQKSLGLTPASAASSTDKESTAKETRSENNAAASVETVPITKVLVNVNGTMGSRYLLSSYVLAGKGPDFPAKVEQHKPQLLDVASSALSTKTIADLEKPTARNLIRSELITAFNSVLGNNAVQDLFITEFAIQ